MCRVCKYIFDSKRDTVKGLNYLEDCHKELLLKQQQIIDSLVEILSYIYPRKEIILNYFRVVSYRRSKRLPTELIVVIKDNLLFDLKEINQEILLNKSFINKRKGVLKTLEDFLPESLCQETTTI